MRRAAPLIQCGSTSAALEFEVVTICTIRNQRTSLPLIFCHFWLTFYVVLWKWRVHPWSAEVTFTSSCSRETQRQCYTGLVSNGVCENNMGVASYSPHVNRYWQFQVNSVSQKTHKCLVKQVFQTKKFSFHFNVEWW